MVECEACRAACSASGFVGFRKLGCGFWVLRLTQGLELFAVSGVGFAVQTRLDSYGSISNWRSRKVLEQLFVDCPMLRDVYTLIFALDFASSAERPDHCWHFGEVPGRRSWRPLRSGSSGRPETSRCGLCRARAELEQSLGSKEGRPETLPKRALYGFWAQPPSPRRRLEATGCW